jgi:hypothetical protein
MACRPGPSCQWQARACAWMSCFCRGRRAWPLATQREIRLNKFLAAYLGLAVQCEGISNITARRRTIETTPGPFSSGAGGLGRQHARMLAQRATYANELLCGRRDLLGLCGLRLGSLPYFLLGHCYLVYCGLVLVSLSFSKPGQVKTGKRGYFGNVESVLLSLQNTKTDPLLDSIQRTWTHCAHSPVFSIAFSIIFSRLQYAVPAPKILLDLFLY